MICVNCFNSDKVIASNSLIKTASLFKSLKSLIFHEKINDFIDAGCSCGYCTISASGTSTKRYKTSNVGLENNCAWSIDNTWRSLEEKVILSKTAGFSSQPAFTWVKSTMETPERWSIHSDVFFVILNRFYTLLWCYHC